MSLKNFVETIYGIFSSTFVAAFIEIFRIYDKFTVLKNEINS